MPRFKDTNNKKGLLVPVIFEEQVLPGTIEHAICDIVDHHLDLRSLYARYKNDVTGAPAFPPAILLKIILVCYSKGIHQSRRMEQAVRTNVTLMAVAEGLTPDHSTIAAFVSSLGDVIRDLFVDVLIRCAQLDLVGGEVFALDGCKFSSNASKEYSGTFAELKRKREKLAAVLADMLARHKAGDLDPDAGERRQAKYEDKIAKIDSFLSSHEPRKETGTRGTLAGATVIADTNYFSEGNCRVCDEKNIDAYIPDQHFRNRDPRFGTERQQHKPPRKNLFTQTDFSFDEKGNCYFCSAGKRLRYLGKLSLHGHRGRRYIIARQEECASCLRQARCLKKGAKARHLFIIDIPRSKTHSVIMMEKIDSSHGREIYSRRMGIVEPVFANIKVHKGLSRFTLRTKKKVNAQWLLFCLVHNIGKIAKRFITPLFFALIRLKSRMILVNVEQLPGA